eukprot:CAMPEP_0172662506 /NCGR_PEP_ID=MMETSP1074-20121228/5401_1 /TAXON_ID=2916 /ORGANISM="Ceratium fusus, Strain PA161109" /LENGTH=79 /DNA_ID=CAMNT_0013478429 /DNA_START=242 /DNA_END=481 /DNA_ORIENTATION=+
MSEDSIAWKTGDLAIRMSECASIRSPATTIVKSDCCFDSSSVLRELQTSCCMSGTGAGCAPLSTPSTKVNFDVTRKAPL